MISKYPIVSLPISILALIGVHSSGVPIQSVPEEQESWQIQRISTDLLSRYASPEDSLRRKAAEFLLAGLPLQWHYDTQVLEETGAKRKVMDAEIIDADYLAENIEYAFRAWALPGPTTAIFRTTAPWWRKSTPPRRTCCWCASARRSRRSGCM